MSRIESSTKTSRLVSASALGQYVFCPEAWRLTASGARQNQAARRRMQAGAAAHERWQRHQDTLHDKGPVMNRLVIVIIVLLALLAFVWGIFGIGR